MNYLKKYILFFAILIILSSCGNSWNNFRKTMTGEKVTTTDEFLIKKKDPLVLPPEYETLPLPKIKEKDNRSSVETSLGSKKTQSSSENPGSVENAILKELRKKN